MVDLLDHVARRTGATIESEKFVREFLKLEPADKDSEAQEDMDFCAEKQYIVELECGSDYNSGSLMCMYVPVAALDLLFWLSSHKHKVMINFGEVDGKHSERHVSFKRALCNDPGDELHQAYLKARRYSGPWNHTNELRESLVPMLEKQWDDVFLPKIIEELRNAEAAKVEPESNFISTIGMFLNYMHKNCVVLEVKPFEDKGSALAVVARNKWDAFQKGIKGKEDTEFMVLYDYEATPTHRLWSWNKFGMKRIVEPTEDAHIKLFLRYEHGLMPIFLGCDDNVEWGSASYPRTAEFWISYLAERVTGTYLDEAIGHFNGDLPYEFAVRDKAGCHPDCPECNRLILEKEASGFKFGYYDEQGRWTRGKTEAEVEAEAEAEAASEKKRAAPTDEPEEAPEAKKRRLSEENVPVEGVSSSE